MVADLPNQFQKVVKVTFAASANSASRTPDTGCDRTTNYQKKKKNTSNLQTGKQRTEIERCIVVMFSRQVRDCKWISIWTPERYCISIVGVNVCDQLPSDPKTHILIPNLKGEEESYQIYTII